MPLQQRSVSTDSQWYSCRLLLPELDSDEDNEQDAEKSKENYYTVVRPVLLPATPLKSKEQAHHAKHKDNRSIHIKALNLLSNGWYYSSNSSYRRLTPLRCHLNSSSRVSSRVQWRLCHDHLWLHRNSKSNHQGHIGILRSQANNGPWRSRDNASSTSLVESHVILTWSWTQEVTVGVSKAQIDITEHDLVMNHV